MRRIGSRPHKEPHFGRGKATEPTLPDFDNLPPIMEPDRRPHPMDGLSPGDIIARAAMTVPENTNPDSEKNKALPEQFYGADAADAAGGQPLARARRRPADRMAARLYRSARALRYVPVALLLLAGPVWLWASGKIGPIKESVAKAATGIEKKAHAALDLRLRQVLVTGRVRTSPQALRQALRAGRGADMMSLDLAAIRQRVEALPWIKSAVIERRLPNTLYLRLQERTPIARLLAGGQQALVGSEGAVIAVIPGKRYEKLPLLAGPGAPKAAPALLRLLSMHRVVGQRVIAARRHGDRRWDLLFDNGVVLSLPSRFETEAWTRFVAIERAHRLLERGVVRIDMRLPDRLVIQRKPAPKPDPEAKTGDAPANGRRSNLGSVNDRGRGKHRTG